MADFEDLDDEAYFSDGIEDHSLTCSGALGRLEDKLARIVIQVESSDE